MIDHIAQWLHLLVETDAACAVGDLSPCDARAPVQTVLFRFRRRLSRRLTDRHATEARMVDAVASWQVGGDVRRRVA